MKLLLAILALTLLTITPGCALFQTACSKAMPVLVAGQAYAQDAQQAIIALERVVENSHLPPADIAKVRAAMDKADLALRVAEQTMASAAQICKAQDFGTIFGAFVSAWDLVRQIIVTVGLFKPHAGGALAAAAPGMTAGVLADPAIYLKMKGH